MMMMMDIGNLHQMYKPTCFEMTNYLKPFRLYYEFSKKPSGRYLQMLHLYSQDEGEAILGQGVDMIANCGSFDDTAELKDIKRQAQVIESSDFHRNS